jgi:hypothetical protein
MNWAPPPLSPGGRRLAMSGAAASPDGGAPRTLMDGNSGPHGNSGPPGRGNGGPLASRRYSRGDTAEGSSPRRRRACSRQSTPSLAPEGRCSAFARQAGPAYWSLRRRRPRSLPLRRSLADTHPDRLLHARHSPAFAGPCAIFCSSEVTSGPCCRYTSSGKRDR